MRIFVSYSRRDGEVTDQSLRLIEQYLNGIAVPFVHCLQPKHRCEQVAVLIALVRSHMVLLVDSPAARASPWVRLELAIARILLRPVLRLDAADLINRYEIESGP